MKVDLTPAELREFARLWSWQGELGNDEYDLMCNFLVRIRGRASAGYVLALALADAMEERDKALADLEAAREALRLFVKVKPGHGEAVWGEHWPAVRAAWEGK